MRLIEGDGEGAASVISLRKKRLSDWNGRSYECMTCVRNTNERGRLWNMRSRVGVFL